MFVIPRAKKRVWGVGVGNKANEEIFSSELRALRGSARGRAAVASFPLKHQPLARAGRCQLGGTSVPGEVAGITRIKVAIVSGCPISPKPESKFLGMPLTPRVSSPKGKSCD